VPENQSAMLPTPRARVQAMKEYHPPLGNRDLLRLDFNENTVACSPRVREALGSISAGALTRYPEREPVEAIVATYLGLESGQVALTNGVDEAIHVLFEAFLDAGDELLLPSPTPIALPALQLRVRSFFNSLNARLMQSCLSMKRTFIFTARQ